MSLIVVDAMDHNNSQHRGHLQGHQSLVALHWHGRAEWLSIHHDWVRTAEDSAGV